VLIWGGLYLPSHVAEANGFAGIGAELVARIQERCFYSLDAPVLRVAGFDVPYPPPLYEHHYLPGVDRILDALDRLEWEDHVTKSA
jgi:pyruvate dehydrogenase E1 component beta subunit